LPGVGVPATLGPMTSTLTDRATSPEVTALIAGWRQTGAADVGARLLELDLMFDGYVWYLVAEALGDDDAADVLEGMQTAEVVCDEDLFLASLQVAAWFIRGHHVDVDPAPTRPLLEQAALPFLELPPAHELAAAPDVTAARDAAWAAALARFGFPPEGVPLDLATAERLLGRILAETGWPATLDLARSLGPSMPDRPYWLHPRHDVG
jgi:hypothetical protein